MNENIIQPEVDDEPSHTIFTRDMLPVIRKRLEDIIQSRENNNGVIFNVSDKCTYCGRKATCPAVTDVAITYAQQQYQLALPDKMLLGVDHSPEDLAKIQAVACLIAEYADAVKKECSRLVKEQYNGSIPGFTLVERQGNLKVLDKDAFLEYCLNKGITARDIVRCSTISVKQVVELAKDNYGHNIDTLLNEMAENNVAQRGDPSCYLKRKPKTDFLGMLKD
jgi:hypothetical protein